MQVSLITCTRNSEKTIKNCCLSISSQTHDNIEHIISDKNSQDKTISTIKKYGIKNLIIHEQKSLGIYGAINEGMRKSNGDIIGVLHSDDEFIDKNVIKIICEKFLQENLDVLFQIYFTPVNIILIRLYENGNQILKEGIQSNSILSKKINNGWMPPHTAIFFKKDLLNRIGYYNENFIISSDYDFIIRMFKEENLKIYFLNKYTIKMRMGGISNKNIQNIFLKMKEDLNIMKKFKLNVFKCIFVKNFSKIKQFF